jgi:hypothetical protein
MLSFIESSKQFLRVVFTNLPLHQQRINVLVAPCPCQYLVVNALAILAVRNGGSL